MRILLTTCSDQDTPGPHHDLHQSGGIAGNAIEKRTGDQTWYNVTVLMNDGRTIVVTQDDLAGVREGSRVVVRDGRALVD